jgi:hypothetical protein
MKDNKYAPYILGPILLMVWGLIFYKIYQAVYSGEENFDIPQYSTLPVFEEKQKDDTYVLLADYKDPFLGKRFNYASNENNRSREMASRNANSRPKTNSASSKPVVRTIASKPFPAFVYQGFQIMDADTVALVKINNRFYPVARKGNTIQGVEVKGIYKDSIQVQFENQQQTFLKKR